MTFLRKLFNVLKQMAVDFLSFIKYLIIKLGPIQDSIAGEINEQELYRVLSTAGTISGGFFGLCSYLYDNASVFVNDPVLLNGVRAFVTVVQNNRLVGVIFAVVFVGDFIRRKYGHGK